LLFLASFPFVSQGAVALLALGSYQLDERTFIELVMAAADDL
jgi:hypothetical protein